VQTVLEQFFLWFVGFGGASAAVLLAAHLIARRRRAHKLRQTVIPSRTMPTAAASASSAARARWVVLTAAGMAAGVAWALTRRPELADAALWTVAGTAAGFVPGTLWLWAASRRVGEISEAVAMVQLLEIAAVYARPGIDAGRAISHAIDQLRRSRHPVAAAARGRRPLARLERRLDAFDAESARMLRESANSSPADLRQVADRLHRRIAETARAQSRRASAGVRYPLACILLPALTLLAAGPLVEDLAERLSMPQPTTPSSPSGVEPPPVAAPSAKVVPLLAP
jgi:hypothetical protein